MTLFEQYKNWLDEAEGDSPRQQAMQKAIRFDVNDMGVDYERNPIKGPKRKKEPKK